MPQIKGRCCLCDGTSTIFNLGLDEPDPGDELMDWLTGKQKESESETKPCPICFGDGEVIYIQRQERRRADAVSQGNLQPRTRELFNQHMDAAR